MPADQCDRGELEKIDGVVEGGPRERDGDRRDQTVSAEPLADVRVMAQASPTGER